MQEVGQVYDSLIANDLRTQLPRIPFYSTVTSQQLHKAEDFGPHYWRQNMESPVWFYQGFNCLLHSEIGKDAIFWKLDRIPRLLVQSNKYTELKMLPTPTFQC
jgi:hypothetical protein